MNADEMPEPPPIEDEYAPPTLNLIHGESSERTQVKYLTSSLGSCCKLLRDNEIREMLLGPGRLEYNELTKQPEYGRQPITDALPLKFREVCERLIRSVDQAGGLDRNGKPKTKVVCFNQETTWSAFQRVAFESSYHPVREYLDNLPAKFSGVETSGLRFAGDLLGLAENSLQRKLLRLWAIGCVARVYEPGCLHKSVLVFVGPQNAGKSSFFRTMASDPWFSDTDMDLRKSDAYLQLHSAWIYEWSELSSMRSGDMERIKAFVSSPHDTFRVPYGHAIQKYPRSTVIVGSTNSDDFLSDNTGNVRFWAIQIQRRIDIRMLALIRDEFWFEALEAYRQQEPWWLTNAADQSELQEHQEQFEAQTHDSWVEPVAHWLTRNPTPITIRAALVEAISMRLADIDRRSERRMQGVFRSIRLKPTGRQRDENGVPLRVWSADPSQTDGSIHSDPLT